MASKDYFVKEIEIDLQKYWQVLKRRWLLAVAVCGVTTALAAFAVNSKKPVYEAQAKLLFEANQASSLVGLEGASRELKALTSRDDPLDTQVEIFRSIPIAEQVIEKLQMRTSEGDLIQPGALLANLSVSGVPGTDVLKVSYTSPDPELAATVVNTVMEIYIQNDIQANRAAAVAAQEFIADQLPETEAEVSAAESELRVFKESNSIVDLGAESQNTVEVLSELDNVVTDLRADLADSSAKYAEIQRKLRLTPQEAYAVGLVSESPGVQEVLLQLQVVQSELAVESTRYEEAHPAIAGIRRQQDALTSLLERRIGTSLGDNQSALPIDDLQAGALEQGLIAELLRLEAERSGLQQRLGELSGAQANQQARAQTLPGLEKRQRELERQLNAAQTTYETLLENLQQAQVLENQNVGNARVVSPALVPTTSIAPSIQLYLIAGGLVGALLGITAAFLVDLIDRSIKTVREGQELYEYPLLGVIPAWKKLPRSAAKEAETPSIKVREPQPVPIVEAYQALQANLKFSYLDKTLKTIAVTSAVAGEGKSEVAANLGLTLAQLGHLVLIVDADMRKPVQHHIWDVPNLQGLSNVVAGQLPLKKVIYRKEPNLHVLPVGVIPPNPLAILESKQISALLDACKRVYDYIIIDTPAILGLTDTLTLGRVTDGMLLVMQPGRVDVDSINAVKAMLSQSQQKVLGVVANGIKVKSKQDRYFYYNQEYVISQNQESLLGLSSVASTPS
ncbi:MAG: polysaccharide biosynthesis tyrosine autokinase [Cyanobacteria bacterium P01_A01_bin.114]